MIIISPHIITNDAIWRCDVCLQEKKLGRFWKRFQRDGFCEASEADFKRLREDDSAVIHWHPMDINGSDWVRMIKWPEFIGDKIKWYNMIAHSKETSQPTSIAVHFLDRSCINFPYVSEKCIVTSMSKFFKKRNFGVGVRRGLRWSYWAAPTGKAQHRSHRIPLVHLSCRQPPAVKAMAAMAMARQRDRGIRATPPQEAEKEWFFHGKIGKWVVQWHLDHPKMGTKISCGVNCWQMKVDQLGFIMSDSNIWSGLVVFSVLEKNQTQTQASLDFFHWIPGFFQVRSGQAKRQQPSGLVNLARLVPVSRASSEVWRPFLWQLWAFSPGYHDCTMTGDRLESTTLRFRAGKVDFDPRAFRERRFFFGFFTAVGLKEIVKHREKA